MMLRSSGAKSQTIYFDSLIYAKENYTTSMHSLLLDDEYNK